MSNPTEFPQPIPLKKMIGPSFIILALGLGSGEVILWPYLVANYGLGIAWGAVLGITCQFFINLEIERYALVRGESVFVGLAKQSRILPLWFIFSTFLGFGLPGIIAASAQLLASAAGWTDYKILAAVFLVCIGLILSLGKTVYGLMERITKTVIMVGVPFILFLAIWVSTKTDWSALALGIIGRGNGYNWLPEGIILATFLGAFAYSGAGGNLNLTQSIYIKEKGYGMGAFAQKIAGLFHRGASEPIQLDGVAATDTAENRQRFGLWWKLVNAEHALVFWGMGTLAMLLLMLLSYATAYGSPNNAQGIMFVINEARVLGTITFPIVGTLFLIAAGIMLFQTQLGVMDSTSRIMAENWALRTGVSHAKNLSKIYATFLWSQIVFGCVLFAFGIHEPKKLIVAGAVLNAVAMFVHIGLVSWLNYRTLPRAFQPTLWRRIILGVIFIFFGGFSFIVLKNLF
ncbi:MAG: hypothetical protein A2821_00365 [Candidatus Magasanikbacteria bacterium RIFCSPHIGHO2_01_FULL_41_23]|uniref:Uncharacterized protein n=1 Tax=Candidatus Magasanikbacteria bacterium RIFCSPLOWO2_01_FULL_40_15 TaxID=1798686 RepID=A0A1F6N063_9BACT|nr:MAG: hypothetical protein A2821_00365 [Candidatus Magasanikbacteria bacterium RIFCSPHIGHO2_01_FULL_41_23]OGH74632.1 MAG: hypothetical protein A3F22_01720 [Candidatus Magasanikbacteria bacterium RIFCSPHIGHO2_12_FULL_41_16]OGH77345.1 MAG: hypothetical protein A2983_01420 [Candidatus Magasanikbacteria bacterium RIFCSPLOWO2_01_FULL_40_15]